MDHSLSSSVKLSYAMSGHPRWMDHGLTKCGPLKKGVGSCVRHYWQNRGTALNPLPLFCRHRPGMKELGFVILTCFFLSSVKLTEENIKVLIVFERSMRRHKAFCSCAQRIIHKVNHWQLFKDFYKKVFQGEHRGRSLRPWEGFLSEAYLWEKCLWQRSWWI